MLTGTYPRTLDSKTRFTLPQDFRKELDGQVCLIPINGALYGFTTEGFRAWVDSQFERGGQHYDPRSKDDFRLRRGLTAAAQTSEVDSAGRVALGKLGAKVLDRLSFGHDICVLGVDDHFEVWDADKWNAEFNSFEDDLDELLFGTSL